MQQNNRSRAQAGSLRPVGSVDPNMIGAHDPIIQAKIACTEWTMIIFSVVFIATFILCAIFVPWPNLPGTTYTLQPNSQQLFKSNGEFIESVVVTGQRGPDLLTFSSEPERNAERSFNSDMTFRPSTYNANNWYEEIHVNLFQGSVVSFQWNYDGGCPLEFSVLKGDATANSFFNRQSVPTTLSLSFSSSYPSSQITIPADDTYYFVFSNLGASCTPSASGTASFTFQAVSYNLVQNALDYVCPVSFATCIDYIPYPQKRWYLLLAPVDNLSSEYSANWYSYGRGWTYVSLYLGLFVAFLIVSAILQNHVNHLKKSNLERAPLLN